MSAEHAQAPHTDRDDLVEDLHGQRIADPYRWLEDPDSERTRDWVRRQNAWTDHHLDALDHRRWFTETMERIVCRPRIGLPRWVAGHWLITRNDGTQAQDVWWIADDLDSLDDDGPRARVLIDPQQLSEDGSVSVAAVSASRDDRWLSYARSEGGSDWWRFDLIDLQTGEPVGDEPAVYGKFGAPVWLPDDSYLYLGFPEAGSGDGTDTGALGAARLMRHRRGTPAGADEVVLELPEEPEVHFYAEVSHDERWVVVHLVKGTENRNRIWALPIAMGDDDQLRLGDPVAVVAEPEASYEFVRSVGEELIFATDLDAPRGRVVAIDPRAGISRPRELVAQTEDTIQAVAATRTELIIIRLRDAAPSIERYDLDGRPLGPVAIEGGAVLGLDADADRDTWTIGVGTITEPLVSHLVEHDQLRRLPGPSGAAISPEYTIGRRHATSPDGTAVPYWVITPAGIDPDRPHPTLLYGYGGFKVPVLADYRPSWPGWLAAGGVLVIANLRGGGEFGTDWYDQGRREHKQNVFDDFIAVAEQLITDGVTTSERLALMGRSNGGLLVGATMTQRPDLAAVALPGVGVLDLLRFHLFTIGRAWKSDYGDPEIAEDFERLLRYSPLHRIEPGTHYPATLITTGDHDDRVVPLRSHKFAAALQQAQAGRAPILTRVETDTGHGLGKPLPKVAAEYADVLAFAAHHTGLQPLD